ncbi:hypothetical protein J0H58_23780 [bacterium]|nr:hypothetical protein [bacterium]
MSHAPLALSLLILLVNVAYSVHALVEWRREVRARQVVVRVRRKRRVVARPLDLAPVCAAC